MNWRLAEQLYERRWELQGAQGVNEFSRQTAGTHVGCGLCVHTVGHRSCA